jgi:quercetin dioxygenase-like cupin family protein
MGAVAIALGLVTWGVGKLEAQQPGFKRVELQKHDLSAAGHEVVMARGEINAGATVPRHSHPGEEVAYVLDGDVTVTMDGKPPMTLKAGDVFFIPAGTIHMAKNTGKTEAKILSTYIVEKGKPLAMAAK